MSAHRYATHAFASLLAAVLSVAVIGKFLDPGPFYQSLAAVLAATGVSGKLALYIASFVIGVEIVAISCLILPAWRRIGASAALAILLAGVPYMLILSGSGIVDCGCFGNLIRSENSMLANVLRNSALSLLAASVLLGPAPRRLSDVESMGNSDTQQCRPNERPAFTLIETLVAIGVLALLLGLTLAALAGVRRTADRAVENSELRDAAMLITQYSVSHDGFPPTVTRYTDVDVWGNHSYEGVSLGSPEPMVNARGWPTALARDIGFDALPIESIGEPVQIAGAYVSTERPVVFSAMVLTPTLWVDRRFFSDPPGTYREARYRLVDARFSSAKAMLVDIRGLNGGPELDPAIDLATAAFDGSVRTVNVVESLREGRWIFRPEIQSYVAPGPGLSTTDGIHGRDW